MFFRQILHEDIGCASYLIADGGEAVVVDPKWEIEHYLSAARVQNLPITRILETHTHADHVSGRGRLAEATGARALTEHEDGSTIELGDARIVALATPGHRPEHTAFVVYDRSRSDDEPWLVLTGDSLLVSVSRGPISPSTRKRAPATSFARCGGCSNCPTRSRSGRAMWAARSAAAPG